MRRLEERLQPAPLVKPFFAVARSGQGRHRAAEERLEEAIGPLDVYSEVYCFSEFSSYYDAEFGGRTWKYLIAAKNLVSADKLVSMKLRSEEIQRELASSGKNLRRTVNIDPGYINGWQVVLSSVKNYNHRIYLRSGIYAEVTLLYRKARFIPLPWTYPDYKSPLVQQFLHELRNIYRDQLDAKNQG